MGTGKKKIGLLVGNYHTDHPNRMVKAVWELLRDEDVELQVFLGTESASFMKEFTMRSSQFDYQYASMCGYTRYEDLDLLIISAGTLSIYQNMISLDEFLEHTSDIPKILLETVRDNEISLIADNTQGLSACVEHLITEHGLTRIGFLTGPKNNVDAEERFAGYRDTLLKHGIPIREDYIALGDYSENVDRSVEELLDRAPDLEAIASANDEMTVAIYRVCQKRGLIVGKDIAVTGFDDMQRAQYMEPPLTTARQDSVELSKVAVETALGILEGEKAFSRRIPVPFIRRCSCGCAPAAVDPDEFTMPKREELLRNMLRSREYQHNSWLGALMNREMLMEVGNSKRFFEAIGSFMSYLGTAASYLCLFEHAIRVRQGTIPEFPEKLFVCMRQQGQDYEGYDWDEAPVMYRKKSSQKEGFQMSGSFMTFLLFDGKYQYGVLNVGIEPENIDFYYMLSLDIGTNLRYMDMWAKQKMYRAELQEMARTDTLTGLNNRAGVIYERESMVGRTSRMAGVIMADLDHLKQINDQFGHKEGDFALQAVADILRRVLGESREDGVIREKQEGGEAKDTGDREEKAASTVIGRIGGDEFMCCAVGVTKKELEDKVSQIREECVRFNEKSVKPYYVEISSGIAVGKVRSIEDWNALSNRADEELYEAKKYRREFVVRSTGGDSCPEVQA